MNEDRWRRVEQVFDEVVALPPEERKPRLDVICGDDADLKVHVESLLAHTDETGHAGDPGVRGSIERAAAGLVAAQSAPEIGRRLGPWQLESLIARGGMGAVYLAKRADGQFEQRAAVKLIDRGTLSPEALQRFNSERQILASLDHPNVARLIDGGTSDDGVPWLAMELVDGVRIDTYCGREGLDVRARLELFRKVCSAVQYAHRNLIVHRDIKPSNILVDVRGEPKLLDFGVAKLFGGDRQDLTVTVADRRALTPRYSSPEQLRGLPLTTATDVYSLAVLLYELLVGSDPYGPDSTEPIALHKAICETEPQAPSVAALRVRDATVAPLAARRLQRALKGDLDNIVLMGLRKEPERRYESVQDLSDDLERYLNDEPVRARPDTWSYRAAKFLKRRRVPVLAATGALIVLATSSTLFVNRILVERDAAEAARARAEQMSAFLQELLRGADRFESAGRDVAVRDILDAGAQRVRTELADQPVEQARMMQTIADSYHTLSLYEPAMELTQLALEIRRRELGPSNAETLQSMRELGDLTYLTGGDTQEALALLERTLELQRAAFGPDSSELAGTYNVIGVVQRVLGNPSESLAALRAAREIMLTLPPEHSERRFEPLVVNQIGSALDSMGEREGALAAYREALALFEARGELDHPVVGALQHNIGLTLRAQGKLEEALPYLRSAIEHTRRVLGEESEDYEIQLSSLGRTLAQLRRFDEANDYVEQALAVAETLYGTDHQYYAYNLVNVARLRQLEGRHAEAIALLERATAIYREAFGPYHRFLAAAEVGHADSLIEVGRVAEAEALIRGTLARIREDPEHERHIEALARSVHGRALALLGRADEADPLLTESVADLRELVGDEHQLTAQAALNLVTFLDDRGDTAAADEYRPLLEHL
jgi:serine/threonine-protein kinase